MRAIHVLTGLVLLAIGLTGCATDSGPNTQAPNARFTYTVEGQTVTFTDASIGASTYGWNFGDGNISTEASPKHTYEAGGNFLVELTVSNAAGEDNAAEFVEIEEPFDASNLEGSWKMLEEAGSLAVGPTEGSEEWWSIPADDITIRACYFDDTYTFNADGGFAIDMGDETILEEWQADTFECGSPVAPHDGTASYTYEVTEKTITIIGEGGFIGLPKVGNEGELPDVGVPTEITYKVADFLDDGTTRSMTLSIEAGSGVFWTFKLVSP